jgi:hypothetical protein
VEGLVMDEEELTDEEWAREWGKQMKILEMVEVEEEMVECLPKADEPGVAQKIKELVARKAELTRE